jgi:FAD/FMN-containing dehydrogenase
MEHRSSRGAFLKKLSSAAALVSSGHTGPLGGARVQRVATQWTHAPKLSYSSIKRLAAGRIRTLAVISIGPAAVLKPRTVEDVRRIVRFANDHARKVTMRGRGHSQYGQALAQGGIVIDSSTLNGVSVTRPPAEAQAGAMGRCDPCYAVAWPHATSDA